jgi:hypothetical protein
MPGASLLMNSRTSALNNGYGLLALHRHGMALGYPVQIASRFLGGICFHLVEVMSDPGVLCHSHRCLLISLAPITARPAAPALLAFFFFLTPSKVLSRNFPIRCSIHPTALSLR